MKEQLEEIQRSIQDLLIQIEEIKSKLEYLKDQETIIVSKDDFKKIRLKKKTDHYLLYDLNGMGFVLGVSGTENIKEKLLSGSLDYLVLEKMKKPKSWYSFKQTHRVLNEEEAVLKVLYP